MSRRSHLIYTLGQFTKPSPETGMILPEEKLLKRYIDSRKKEYLEFVKQNERQAAASASSAIELKQTATRVTIEGDHVCLFLIKRVNAAQDIGQAMGSMEQPQMDTRAKSTLYEIQITPILNAPYQLAEVKIAL